MLLFFAKMSLTQNCLSKKYTLLQISTPLKIWERNELIKTNYVMSLNFMCRRVLSVLLFSFYLSFVLVSGEKKLYKQANLLSSDQKPRASPPGNRARAALNQLNQTGNKIDSTAQAQLSSWTYAAAVTSVLPRTDKIYFMKSLKPGPV